MTFKNQIHRGSRSPRYLCYSWLCAQTTSLYHRWRVITLSLLVMHTTCNFSASVINPKRFWQFRWESNLVATGATILALARDWSNVICITTCTTCEHVTHTYSRAIISLAAILSQGQVCSQPCVPEISIWFNFILAHCIFLYLSIGCMRCFFSNFLNALFIDLYIFLACTIQVTIPSGEFRFSIEIYIPLKDF